MKKLIAMLVALTMVLSLSAVFAASVDAGDVVDVVTPVTPATTTETEEEVTELPILKVEETEETKELVQELLEAQNSTDEAVTVASVFPEEMQVDKKSVVQEVISVDTNPAFEFEAGKDYESSVAITADVSNAVSVRAFLKLSYENPEDDTWFELENVRVGEDGHTLTVTYTAEMIAAMKNAKSAALVVLSVPAE